MNKPLRPLAVRLRRRLPLAYMALVQRPRAFLRFRDERRSMRGESLSESRHPSVVFFTAHKCASVFVSRILHQLTQPAGLVHLNYEGYFALTDVRRYELFRSERFQQAAYKRSGYYYGAFRWFHPIPNLSDYRVLLLLRDPRDVVTSYYYSMAYSHQIMSRDVLERRTEALQVGLDEYALRIRRWLAGVYRTYCTELLGMPNVLLVKYEDMVTDFEEWLRSVATHLSLGQDADLLQQVVAQADFAVSGENVHAHKRQVAPGEHRRKLAAETQDILEAEFRDILEELDYPLHR
jgi:hypothetical protein